MTAERFGMTAEGAVLSREFNLKQSFSADPVYI